MFSYISFFLTFTQSLIRLSSSDFLGTLFRKTFKTIEIALYHSLGKLPEPTSHDPQILLKKLSCSQNSAMRILTFFKILLTVGRLIPDRDNI